MAAHWLRKAGFRYFMHDTPGKLEDFLAVVAEDGGYDYAMTVLLYCPGPKYLEALHEPWCALWNGLDCDCDVILYLADNLNKWN